VHLQPQVFFLLILPPLQILDGWRIPKDPKMRDRRAILQLAFGLVFFTVVGAGYLIHWLIPAVPLAVAFALAAIVSPTDPVAVSSIAGSAPILRRLMHVLEGESLLNDASGLVCFQFAVAAVLTGTFSFNQATATFAWLVAIGLLSGVAFTLGIALVQQWLTRRFGAEGGSPILVNLLTPFGAYLLAEQFGASGILAAVAAGVTMSYVELSGRSMAVTRIERSAIWDTTQFTLNGVMFVLLGEQLPNILRDAVTAVGESGHYNQWWLLLYAVVIVCGLAALRFVWVWVSLRVYLWRHRADANPISRREGWRVVAVTSLAGVRGAVTLAGVLTLPLFLPDGSRFPARGLVIFLAAAVILLSLVVGSVGLPLLLRGMEQQLEPAGEREADRAQTVAAEAAIESVRRRSDDIQRHGDLDADICAAAESRVIAAYQERLNARDGEADENGAQRLRQADSVERKLRLAGFQAEREAILRLARSRQISDETSRRLVRRIDLLETLYR
jgi:CPA1 family monovalent cation:H+ antiporter